MLRQIVWAITAPVMLMALALILADRAMVMYASSASDGGPSRILLIARQVERTRPAIIRDNHLDGGRLAR